MDQHEEGQDSYFPFFSTPSLFLPALSLVFPSPPLYFFLPSFLPFLSFFFSFLFLPSFCVWYMHVFMFVCVYYTHVWGMCMSTCLWSPVVSVQCPPLLSSSTLFLFETGSHTKPVPPQFSKMSWPVSSQHPPVPAPRHWDCRLLCPTSLHGS